MKIAGFSTAGPRPINEDNFYAIDFSDVRSFSGGISAFIMVSDGMGGHEGGDVASKMAVQSAECYLGQLIEMAESNQVELDVPLAFKEIVRNANDAIRQEMQARGNNGMGATFVGAFISPMKAWIAHVGDSRAYLIHRGVAAQLTKDHSAVGRMLSAGLITEKQAQEHPERNVIERALGFTDDDPEITEIPLSRGDALLLCSDGVSTVLNTQSLVDCVLRAKTIEEAAEDTVMMALKKNSDDNATAVVATMNWSALKAHTPNQGVLERLRAKFGQAFGSGDSGAADVEEAAKPPRRQRPRPAEGASTARTPQDRTSSERTPSAHASSAQTAPTYVSPVRVSPVRTSPAHGFSARTSPARTPSARTSPARASRAKTNNSNRTILILALALALVIGVTVGLLLANCSRDDSQQEVPPEGAAIETPAGDSSDDASAQDDFSTASQ
jgi:protein phosphatase